MAGQVVSGETLEVPQRWTLAGLACRCCFPREAGADRAGAVCTEKAGAPGSLAVFTLGK